MINPMHRSTIALIAAALVIAGCGGAHSVAPLNITSSGTKYKFKATAKVIDAKSEVTVVSQTKDTIVLSCKVPALKVGDVFVSKLGKGAIGRVATISAAGGQTTITLTKVDLREAFDQLKLSLPPFGKAQLGELGSTVPGVTLSWKDNPKKPTKSIGSTIQVLVDGVSVGASATANGAAYIEYNPVLDFTLSPVSMDYGSSPHVTGSISLAVSGVASFSFGEVKFFEKYFDPVFPDPELPFIFFVPHLVVQAELSGSADGQVSAEFDLDSGYTNVEHYRESTGWTYTREPFDHSKGLVIKGQGGFTVNFYPIKATLEYELEFIGGPYATTQCQVQLQGNDTLDSNNVAGIDATISAGLGGAAGVGLNPDFGVISADAEYNAYVPLVNIYHHFFPFSASMTVGDPRTSGNQKPDKYDVTLDGALLGSTPPGGSTTFDNLTPGSHALAITCTATGYEPQLPGDNAGILQVTLGNNCSFADGTYKYRNKAMYKGQTVNLTLIVLSPAAKTNKTKGRTSVPQRSLPTLQHDRPVLELKSR